MKTLFLLSFLLSPILLQAQIPNSNLKDLSAIPCPFDPSVEVVQPDYWRLYQTLDGNWDGPIDSTICISVEQISSFYGGIRVDFNQIDPARPLYMRWLADNTSKIFLDPAWIYQTMGHMTAVGGTQFDPSNQCADALCTGIIVGVEIPDESGDSTQLRIYVGPFEDNYYGTYVSCVPTENFPENYLREFIFKIQVDTANIPSENFAAQIYYAGVGMMSDVGHIYEVNASEEYWDGQSYQIWNYDLAIDGSQNSLFMYGAPTYPSLDYPYFMDAIPEVNTTYPKTININIASFTSTYFQPFTYLRGGLVLFSDSIRHEVNLVNWGSNICLDFVELVFGENTNYVHYSGQLDFSGETACMQFRQGSALVVADSTTLHFGPGGHGMLALRTGGSIDLGKGSTLLIDNMLMLTPYHPDPTDPESRQVYMELNPGSTLAFGEHASIMRKFNPENDMRLNIYMNGGNLDDSRLPPEDRLLINRIYPLPSANQADNIRLSPNPASDILECRYLAEGASTLELEIFNIQGQSIIRQKFPTEKGFNFLSLSVEALPTGWYTLQVSDPIKGSTVKPWLKL
ncbi:MAG: T9SS type A sorting domain-containing protein [Saprospirales bacterium]|nr:T9SS type A sorting domain-containing protein [Saprospirales bacterium]